MQLSFTGSYNNTDADHIIIIPFKINKQALGVEKSTITKPLQGLENTEGYSQSSFGDRYSPTGFQYYRYTMLSLYHLSTTIGVISKSKKSLVLLELQNTYSAFGRYSTLRYHIFGYWYSILPSW